VRLVAACDDVTTPRVATELKPRRKFSAHFIETNSQWISRDCEHHCRKRENKPAVPFTDVRFGSKADMTGLICDVRFTPKSGHQSEKRFNELPDLDHFLRSAAVPVIAIPLAFRRTAACAVHSGDGTAPRGRDVNNQATSSAIEACCVTIMLKLDR
jgi:hypothetical protein